MYYTNPKLPKCRVPHFQYYLFIRNSSYKIAVSTGTKSVLVFAGVKLFVKLDSFAEFYHFAFWRIFLDETQVVVQNLF